MARRPKKYNIPKETQLTGKERAVIYVRVSSPNQVKQWHWLESQEILCRKRAEENNVEVVSLFADWWVSGKFASRVELDKMIEFLHKQNTPYTKVHFVIIDDMDRIMRDVVGWWEVKARVEDYWWAKIYALKQKIEDTPEWTMIQTITMSVKQYQRESNARQVADRQRWRMLNWYWCLYPPPCYKYIEYEETPWRKNKKLILDDGEDEGKYVKTIKEGLELFAKGIILNKKKLLEYYNANLLKWRRKDWKLYQEFVNRLLKRNRLLFYAWYINYEEWDVKMIPAKHPSIIELATVWQIEERLNPRSVNQVFSRKDTDERLILRWFLYCPECGHRMTWAPSRNRRGTYYFYYLCRNTGCSLNRKSFNSDVIHKEFQDHLSKLSVPNKVIDLLGIIFDDLWSKKGEIQWEILKDLQKRIKEIDEEVRAFKGRMITTTKDNMVEFYENTISTLLEEKQLLEMKLKTWETSSDTDYKKLLEETKAILVNPKFIWEIWGIELKHLLLGVCYGGKILYTKNQGLQTPEIPLIYMLKEQLSWDKKQDLEMVGFEPTSKRHKQHFLPL